MLHTFFKGISNKKPATKKCNYYNHTHVGNLSKPYLVSHTELLNYCILHIMYLSGQGSVDQNLLQTAVITSRYETGKAMIRTIFRSVY